MKISTPIICALFFLSISGCAPDVKKSILQKQEEALGTAEGVTIKFHSALYYPNEIGLDFPGYIVGIEKSPVDTITSEQHLEFISVPEAGKTPEEFSKDLIQKKIMYVSHILESKNGLYGLDNHIHYTE